MQPDHADDQAAFECVFAVSNVCGCKNNYLVPDKEEQSLL